MVLKKQTVWLLSMLTIMVVLSAYYLVQGPVEQVPANTITMEEPVTEDEAADIQVNSKQLEEQPDVDVNVATESSSDYFAKVKMDREAWDSKALNDYREVWVNSDASVEAITDAKASYDNLLTKQDAQMNVESLIKALGYEEVVIISKDSSVNVVVQSEKMEPQQAVEIVSIINQQLKVPSNNVVVSYKP